MRKKPSQIFEGKNSSLRKTYEEAVKPKPCIVKDCGKPSKIRGLCKMCYTNANYIVTCGKTTWDFLEKNNLAKPPKIGVSRFTKEFEKLVPKTKLKGKEHLKEI